MLLFLKNKSKVRDENGEQIINENDNVEETFEETKNENLFEHENWEDVSTKL